LRQVLSVAQLAKCGSFAKSFMEDPKQKVDRVVDMEGGVIWRRDRLCLGSASWRCFTHSQKELINGIPRPPFS
jgi:hypothetical protein